VTAVQYISDIEEIILASLSNLQHDGVAALNLPEGLPWPVAVSAKYIPGG
jgi:hypothetical protein